MQTKPRSAFLQIYSVIALGLDQCCLHALWYAGTPQGQTYWVLKQMKRSIAELLRNYSPEQNLGLRVFYLDLPNSRKEVWSLRRSLLNSEICIIQHDLKADLSSQAYTWMFNQYSINDHWRNICMDVWISQLFLDRIKTTECQLRKLGWSPNRSFDGFGCPASWIDWKTQIWGKSNRSLQLHFDATLRKIGLSHPSSSKRPREQKRLLTCLTNLTAGCWNDEPIQWSTADDEWQNQVSAWTNFI